jgi:phospholipid-binding lipoprotein MlaA
MRTWLCHGVAAAALLVLCMLWGPAGTAAADAPADAEAPAGITSADPGAGEELDPLFDDAFEAELARTSDMQSSDPFENTNRRVFSFNRGVDRFFFEPVTRGYRFLVPDPARKGIRRVFLNLDSPRILINDLLQLRFEDAATTVGRLLLNSTLGVGGLLDAGEAAGLERHDSDFGQTLARYGVASGPYIVLPVFGPSTVRDGFGSVVDLAFQPLTYILGPGQLLVHVYVNGGSGLTALDANYDKLEALEVSSVDFYAAMRSAYLQNRRAAIAEVIRPSEPASDAGLAPTGDVFEGQAVEARADIAY